MTTDRRQRYRDYMRRMDPTGDPSAAVVGGFYVEPPEGVGQRLAASLDVDVTGSHLVVGGIGSGKSTELIQVQSKLRDTSDVVCFRIDVLAQQQHDKVSPGVLLGLAGLAVADWVEKTSSTSASKEVVDAVRRVRELANGRWVYHWEGNQIHDEPDDSQWSEGVIKTPGRNDTVVALANAMAPLVTVFRSGVVVLFDGLDRLRDLNVFAQVVGHDIPALRSIGVGSVTVGPQECRVHTHNFVLNYFTALHLHGAAAFATDEGQRFLAHVLRSRDQEKLIPDEMLMNLATWSGGVLRDLISLAKLAGEEAYASGHDHIGKPDIDAAADRFGRGLLLGATAEMGARLKELVPPKSERRFGPRVPGKSEPTFVLSADVDIDMLVRRLIVEVPGVPVRYVPHPTLVPLVRTLGSRG